MRKLCFIGVSLLLTLVAVSQAAVVQVPEDQPTIQAAIDFASPGDVVDVAPGTYILSLGGTAPSGLDYAISVDKPITLKSRELYQAVLDGNNQALTLVLIRAAAHLEGFVIQNGKFGVMQRDSANVGWTARNLIVRDIDRSCISIDAVSGRIGSAEINNVVTDNCGRVDGAAFSTNNADGFTIRNSVVTNSFRAFILTDHNFFDVDYTAAYGNGGLASRSSLCLENGGPLPCPINLGPGFSDGVDPLLVDVITASFDFPAFPKCASPLVDSGDPAASLDDAQFPPSLGSVRNDIGAYGGPGATSGLGSADVQDILQQAGCAPLYTCVGFESPLDSGPVTVRKHKALPLKAELIDATGQPLDDFDISAPPVLQVFFDSGMGTAVDVTDDALPAGQGTEGNQFVFSSGRWRFNLKTKNYTAAGTYAIQMASGDVGEYAMDGCVAQFVINE